MKAPAKRSVVASKSERNATRTRREGHCDGDDGQYSIRPEGRN
jgi:hypothetical protein